MVILSEARVIDKFKANLTNESFAYVLRGFTPNQLLFQTNPKSISLFNVEDGRLERSLISRKLRLVSCCPSAGQSIVALTENEKIIQFSDHKDNNPDIKMKLKNVHHLESLDVENAIVVYKDCTIAYLERPHEIIGSFRSQAPTFTRLSLHGQAHYLALYLKESSQQKLIVYDVTSATATTHLSDVLLQGPTADDVLVDLALANFGSELCAYCLWSSGLMQRHAMDKVSQPVEVCWVEPGSSHFLLVSSSHFVVHHGSSLQLWDLQFRTKIAAQDSDGQCLQLHLCGCDFVIVLTSSGIYSFAFTAPASSLASLLGTNQSSAPSTLPGVSFLRDLSNLHGSFFTAKFGASREKLLDLELLDNACQLQQVCQRAVDVKDMEAVSYLVENKLVPVRSYQSIFSLLCDNSCTSEIVLCLNCLPCISEGLLVQVLKSFLRDLTVTMNDGEDCFVFPKSDQTKSLNVVLACPHSGFFLVDELRTLEFDSVLKLLRYLHCLLDESLDEIKLSSDLPSATCVISWISHTLDAHFSQLILSSDSRQLLLQLHQLVESKMQVCQDLIYVGTQLQELSSKKPAVIQNISKQYSIIDLHID